MQNKMNDSEKKEIESRVNKLKKIIDDIEKANDSSGDELEVKIKVIPINPDLIPNFDKYPYEYQCFVKVIGCELFLGTGYEALNLVKPELYDPSALEDGFHDRLSTIWGEFPLNSLLVASYPCDYETLAFCTDTTPYTTVTGSGDSSWGFLEFIENQLLRIPTKSYS